MGSSPSSKDVRVNPMGGREWSVGTLRALAFSASEMDLGVLFLFMFLMKLVLRNPRRATILPKAYKTKSFMCQPCVTTSIMLLAKLLLSKVYNGTDYSP